MTFVDRRPQSGDTANSLLGSLCFTKWFADLWKFATMVGEMDEAWPKKEGMVDDMANYDARSVVSSAFCDRIGFNRELLKSTALHELALVDMSRQPGEVSLSLRDWAAHIGIRAPEGVVIHPGFAEAAVNRLIGRQAFAEVGPSTADFYFAVEGNTEAVKVRVGEFALGLARLVGDSGKVETLRLLKVKPEYLPR